MTKINIKYFQLELTTWSILYLGNVPRTKIAKHIKRTVFINNGNIYLFIKRKQQLLLQMIWKQKFQLKQMP